VIIDGAHVFDGTAWRGRTQLLVRGDRIEDIGTSLPSEGHDTVWVGDTFAVPGLIDAHVHLFPGFLPRLPLFGVTAAVDMFSTPNLLRLLRDERAGKQAAADFITAGVGATVVGGHPCQLAQSGLYSTFPVFGPGDAADDFVSARIAEGSQFLKVFVEDGSLAGVNLPRLTDTQIRELCQAAHAAGLIVVAHAITADSALSAVQAGVDGLAHAIVPERHRRGLPAHLVEALIERKVFLVSTLSAVGAAMGMSVGPSLLDDEIIDRVGARWRAHLGLTAGHEPDRQRWHSTLDAMSNLLAQGVHVLAGTDAAFPGVVPGASLHAELALLVSCGMAPLDAIHAATSAVADAFRLPGKGRIARGGAADILFLRDDPRDDVRRTQQLAAVMVHGRLIQLQPDAGTGGGNEGALPRG
jgi:imidazolonepropionase-like amidohydrolase